MYGQVEIANYFFADLVGLRVSFSKFHYSVFLMLSLFLGPNGTP